MKTEDLIRFYTIFYKLFSPIRIIDPVGKGLWQFKTVMRG